MSGSYLSLLILGTIEDILDREHRGDCEDFVGASQQDRRQQHLGQHRLDWELSHLPPKASEETFLVQSP